jgi:hypothetical protein
MVIYISIFVVGIQLIDVRIGLEKLRDLKSTESFLLFFKDVEQPLSLKDQCRITATQGMPLVEHAFYPSGALEFTLGF